MGAVTLAKDNSKEEALVSDKLVLIDFWALWSGPCRMLRPIINEIANELAGKVKICKVNVDKESELTASFTL